MFREMRRIKQQVSREECVRVLTEEKRGVLSVIGEGGYPYGFPVNYIYDKDDDIIYIHGAVEGQKTDAVKNCSRVSFTTWDKGYKKEGDWAWYVTSVMAAGKAELADDPEVMKEKIRKLGVRFTDEKEVNDMIERNIGRTAVIAIHIEHMTGKLVHEK